MKSRICISVIALAVMAWTSLSQYRYNPNRPSSGTWHVSLSAGMIGLGCDVTEFDGSYRYRPLGDIDVGVTVNSYVGLSLFLGLGKMAAEFESIAVGNDYYWGGIDLELTLPISRGALAPFAFIRTGGILSKAEANIRSFQTEGPHTGAFMYGGGLGLDYVFRRSVGIRLKGGSVLTTSDKLDNIVSGDLNDGMSFISLGVTYYFPSRRR